MRSLHVLAIFLLGWALAGPALAHDTVYYYYNDAQGTPVAMTDANGNVVERSQYAPYGQVLNRALRDGPGYTSHEEDPGTGLVYMQQRYYDPTIGRFLSMDPVDANTVTGGNFDRYWYANDNPYRYTDPDGRESGAGYATGEYQMQFSQADNSDMAGALADAIQTLDDDLAEWPPEIGTEEHFAAVPLIAGLRKLAAAAKVTEKAEEGAAVAEDAAKVGELPKPSMGPGKVPISERDPKRFFTPAEREAKRAEQSHLCANGCGTKIDSTNSVGHHIERHADGGRSISKNHAEVCIPCHKKLHSKDDL